MRLKTFWSSIAGASMALALFAIPTTAFAETPTASSTDTEPMSIDCSAITADGLAYLKAHRISACGVIVSGPTTNVKGTASGNCGVTMVEINNLGGSKAHIRWGATSKIGPISERSITAEWYNETTDKSNTTLDLFPMASPTYVSEWWSPTTGKGTVHAEIHGTIVIDGLLPCSVYDPTAKTKIT